MLRLLVSKDRLQIRTCKAFFKYKGKSYFLGQYLSGIFMVVLLKFTLKETFYINYLSIVSFLTVPISESKVLRIIAIIKKNAFLGVKTRLHRSQVQGKLQKSSSAFSIRDFLKFFNL